MVLSDVRVPSHLPLLLLSRFPSVAYSSDYLDGRSSHYNQVSVSSYDPSTAINNQPRIPAHQQHLKDLRDLRDQMLPLAQIVRDIRCIPQRSIAKLQTYHEAGIQVLGSQFKSGSNKTNRRVPTGASSFRASWSALVRILVSGPTRCQGSAAGFTWKLSAESSKGPDYETVQLQNFRSINYVAFSEAQERGMSLQLTVRGLHANYR
ncbi:unnamed protein product [Fusarium graminearum]|nr:unnamed protein product [Fusarium graminearum]CAG2014077.1 unnamed protein product [Fusarium graminearum]